MSPRCWKSRRSCTRKEFESFTGHLAHATEVIRPGGVFLRSLSSLLSATTEQPLFASAKLSWVVQTPPSPSGPSCTIPFRVCSARPTRTRPSCVPIIPEVLTQLQPVSHIQHMLWAACYLGFHGFLCTGEFTYPSL